MAIRDDFLRAPGEDGPARATFETLNRGDTYAAIRRLAATPRPESRQRRIDPRLAMLERGEEPHWGARRWRPSRMS